MLPCIYFETLRQMAFRNSCTIDYMFCGIIVSVGASLWGVTQTINYIKICNFVMFRSVACDLT